MRTFKHHQATEIKVQTHYGPDESSELKMHFLPPAKLKNFNKDGTTMTFANRTEAAKKLETRGLYKAGREEMVPHDGE